jgi:uncharacterized membrane protein YhaH (DUF805 family)
MDKVVRYTRRAVLENYANFSGRDNKAQFWWFVLGLVIILLPLNLLGGESETFAVLSTLVTFALLIPSIAATTRRLHDTGRSGWWQVIQLIPFAGLAVIIYFTVQPSNPGLNAYGPEPGSDETPSTGPGSFDSRPFDSRSFDAGSSGPSAGYPPPPPPPPPAPPTPPAPPV